MVALAQANPAGASELDVGELYVECAVQVRRLVRHVVRAPQPVIEDACQMAWSQLLCRRGGVRADKAVPWLVTTAVREAFRICRRASREVFIDDLSHEMAVEVSGVFDFEETIEQRRRIASLGALPERQQRLLWLQAAGFSYPEISCQTSITPRTIDRQLQRARRRLREDAG